MGHMNTPLLLLLLAILILGATTVEPRFLTVAVKVASLAY
jgi:hypothetical protein